VFYNNVIINEGKAWLACDSCYISRYSGIYLFTVIAYIHLHLFSTASYKLAADMPKPEQYTEHRSLVTHRQTNSTIIKKQPVVQVSMSNQPGSPTLTTVSASCLVNLSRTDTVEVWLDKNYNWLPDIMTLGTSVSAFYYSPVSNVQVLYFNNTFFYRKN
jgi:hypothetical protein